MAYPPITEYQEAIQHPRTAFTDPELQQAQVKQTSLGLPLAYSGGFALTYMLTTPRRKIAVRCFHREVPGVEERYRAISSALQALHSTYFVPFKFQLQGIRVRDKVYPIVCMDWVDGATLGVYLDHNVTDVPGLRRLREQFQALGAFLEASGIAHGDIQNGNVMVSGGALRLIDYDGMYVSGLPLGKGTETGHKHFQHPGRKDGSAFGPNMDRFSFIVVDLSLQALIEEPSLYKNFREGGEAIIFKANDFADPTNSEIFRILRARRSLEAQVRNFAVICEAELTAVPSLADLLAGRNIPARRPVFVGAPTPKGPPKVQRYIPAFDVIDASDYAGAATQLGNRVELIGCVYDVKNYKIWKGRKAGQPYCFINFGPKSTEIVRITIWAEGLGRMRATPNTSWAGKWISVTGLLEPYRSAQRGYSSVSITVTDEGQIQQLTEAEAKYRLGSASKPAATGNRDLIDRNLNGAWRSRQPSPGPAPAPPPAGAPSGTSRNAAIWDEIRRRHATTSGHAGGLPGPPVPPPTPTTGRTPRPVPTPAPSRRRAVPPVPSPVPSGASSSSKTGMPAWFWWAAAIFVLFVFLAKVGDGPRRSQPDTRLRSISDLPKQSETQRPPAEPGQEPPPAAQAPVLAAQPQRAPRSPVREREERSRRLRDRQSDVRSRASAAPSKQREQSSAVEQPRRGTLSAYHEVVRQEIASHWTIWAHELQGRNPRVLASVRIARDGRVVSARIDSSSGDAYFDRSVARALERAREAGVPPLPEEYRHDEMEIGVVFSLPGDDHNAGHE